MGNYLFRRIELLEGKNLNLRVAEKDDIDFLVESINELNFEGEHVPIEQYSKSELMEGFDNPSNWEVLCETKRFIIQKKDGTRTPGNHKSE